MQAVNQKRGNVLRMTETAVMIAFATVLSEIKIVNLPFGGTVTAFSMLPLILIAYRYGTRWGLLSGFVYSLLQMMLGMDNLRYGVNFLAVAAIILFDYVVAFTALGLAGLFRDKIKNQGLALAAGVVFVSILRYLCHFVSGWAVWSVWAPEGMPAWLYSLGYNASYMVPECLITAVGAVLISFVLDFSSTDITRRGREADAKPKNNSAIAAKLAGFGLIAAGVLYDVFAAVNVLMAETETEMPKEALLAVLAVCVVAGVLLIAIGEIVQILSDMRQQRENGETTGKNQ